MGRFWNLIEGGYLSMEAWLGLGKTITTLVRIVHNREERILKYYNGSSHSERSESEK